MKIAISTDSGRISEHFGRCPEFTILEIMDGKVAGTEVIPNPGHHPGYLPRYFNEMGVEAIIAGGMGFRAQQLFDEMGIKPVVGVAGSVDEVVRLLEAGTLKGGESLCRPGGGKGYGLDKTEYDHPEGEE
jgi:predicted Fe-Mo cluster-binding NifX family protein